MRGSAAHEQDEQENAHVNASMGMKRRKLVDEPVAETTMAGIATPGSLLGKALTEVTEFSTAEKKDRHALMEIDQDDDEKSSDSAVE